MKRKTRDPKLVSDCFVFLCDDFQQMASHFQMIASEKWLISCDFFSGLNAHEDILPPVSAFECICVTLSGFEDITRHSTIKYEIPVLIKH